MYRVILICLSMCVVSTAYGEKFLGIEDGDAQKVESENTITEPTVISTKKLRYSVRMDSLGLERFGARARIHYFYNDYLSIDPGLFYSYYGDGDLSERIWGPALFVTAQLSNPWKVVPFIKSGIEVGMWHFEDENETLEGNSAVVIGSVGLSLSLTKRFGLVGARTISYYLNETPPTIVASDRQIISNRVGFNVIF